MAIVTSLGEWRGLVQIDADGRRLCSVKRSFFAKMPLQVGDEIDEQQYLDRMAAMQLPQCYDDALSLLDFSARASGEMRNKLAQKGYLPPAVDAVMERLAENKLIDDARYAERVVENAKGKPIGQFALKRKLRAKGVDEESAQAALSEIDPDEQLAAARLLAQKLLPKYAGQDRRQARGKLSQALARRGFGWDTISSALEGLLDEDDWDGSPH